jgi:hypothetical protein
MRSIFTGITVAVLLAIAAAYVLEGGLQQDSEQAYHTSGVRL